MPQRGFAWQRREGHDDTGARAKFLPSLSPLWRPKIPAFTVLGGGPRCPKETSLPVLDGVAEVSARDLRGPARHGQRVCRERREEKKSPLHRGSEVEAGSSALGGRGRLAGFSDHQHHSPNRSQMEHWVNVLL